MRALFVLSAILFLHLGLSNGQSSSVSDSTTATDSSVSTTYGTVVSDELINNLAVAEQNLYKGIVAVADPLMKIAVDTAPDVVHIAALLNGVAVPPSIAALLKDIYGRAAVAGGRTFGGAAVLGSSLLKNAMDVGSTALKTGNSIVEAGGKAGINLGGRLADHAINATVIGADVASDGLTALGDGMLVASTGVNVVTQGIANLVQAIGDKVKEAIQWAHQTLATLRTSATKLVNGTYQFNNPQLQQLYNGVSAYLTVLGTVQNTFTNISSVTG